AAALGLGEDVVRGALLAEGVGLDVQLQRSGRRGLHQVGAELVGRADHRDLPRGAGGALHRAHALGRGAVVVDRDGGGAGVLGVAGLHREVAAAALDEGDVPLREAGEVVGLAAAADTGAGRVDRGGDGGDVTGPGEVQSRVVGAV